MTTGAGANAEAVPRWQGSSAPPLWQRRAGLVAFVKLAPRATEAFDGIDRLVLEACANSLAHEGRFAHEGPGWVLRELSRAVPYRRRCVGWVRILRRGVVEARPSV